MAAPAIIWLDGTPVQALPLPDRGLELGDGLFETLLLESGKPLYLEHHLTRLRRGSAALALDVELDDVRAQVDRICQVVVERGWPWVSLRVSLTRGASSRGYAADDNARPRCLLYVYPLDRDCASMAAPARVVLADIRLSLQPALAGLKHSNRLEQVLAASQAKKTGVDEALLLQSDGPVNSVSAGNIFLRRGRQLITPPVRDAGVAGTRRQLILDNWGAALGYSVAEDVCYLDDLQRADEIFYSNSLLGVRPIAQLVSVSDTGVKPQFPTRHWHDHSAAQALFAHYRSEPT